MSFRAGQAVFAGLAESPVKRPYSIACSPAQARRMNAIELLVQIDDDRAPDPHLERATAGTLLRIEGPFGTFGLPPETGERDLLLIAGGTGIAPLRAMLWETLQTQPERSVTLIYSARTQAEFAYLPELTALAGDKQIDLFLTITREDLDWAGLRGRIDRDLIAAALQSTDTLCVVCGPSGLVADSTRLLTAAGVDTRNIVTENYGS